MPICKKGPSAFRLGKYLHKKTQACLHNSTYIPSTVRASWENDIFCLPIADIINQYIVLYVEEKDRDSIYASTNKTIFCLSYSS